MKKVRVFSIVLAVVMLFATVGSAAWYDEAINWAKTEEIIKAESAFDPEAKVTHGDMIGALYACAKVWGKDVSAWKDTNILSYDDAFFLPEGTAESFQWACSAGLIAPDATKLEYDRILTREDMIDLVYEFAGWLGLDRSVGENTNILSYNDAFYISSGKFSCFQWACGVGILKGTPEHNLLPRHIAVKSQMVTILLRLEKLAKPVDYTSAITEWVYQPENNGENWLALKAIDSCQYGTAGATMQQVAAAASLLKLTNAADAAETVDKYLRGMDQTQKDYFSFQWEMSVNKAKELLADPAKATDDLADCGLENLDLRVFEISKLETLDAAVKQTLKYHGVADVWKTLLEQEPFCWYEL